MRRILFAILLATCLWPAVGCQWVGLRDPVPASLTASRRLSSEGNEFLERQQPDKAEAKLAEAVKICPTDCDARRYYAEALWQRSARPEALAQLEEACRLTPAAELRVRLGEMYLDTGRPEVAIHTIDEVLRDTTHLAAAWRVRGRSLRVTGDRLLAAGNKDQARTSYVEALANLHRAAGFDPGDREVIGETAIVYRMLGQPQRALESMQCLLETYTPEEEPQQVLYWAGLDYMALQRYDDAAATFTTALSRDRPTPELFYSLGEAQYRSGRSREAAIALRQALVIDPQHALSRQLLSQISLAQQAGDNLLR